MLLQNVSEKITIKYKFLFRSWKENTTYQGYKTGRSTKTGKGKCREERHSTIMATIACSKKYNILGWCIAWVGRRNAHGSDYTVRVKGKYEGDLFWGAKAPLIQGNRKWGNNLRSVRKVGHFPTCIAVLLLLSPPSSKRTNFFIILATLSYLLLLFQKGSAAISLLLSLS